MRFSSTAGWRAFALAAAVVLYLISLSEPAYRLTSPLTMPHHELVRKTYAVLAFALLGFAFERSELRRLRGVLDAGIVLALYSYAIELGQIVFARSSETFAQHGFDVASGFAGGMLGAFVALLLRAPADRTRRPEALALAVVFALLAWEFTATYGWLG
jgi:glycopeptide antibiotics resistance protein